MLIRARGGQHGRYGSLVKPFHSASNHENTASNPKESRILGGERSGQSQYIPLSTGGKRLITCRAGRAEGGTRYVPSAHHPLWRVPHRSAFDFLKFPLGESHRWVPAQLVGTVDVMLLSIK